MGLALKAPYPILTVLWTHLPSREGDFDSEDGNVLMLLRPNSSSSRTALQEEYWWRAQGCFPFPPLSLTHTKASNVVL